MAREELLVALAQGRGGEAGRVAVVVVGVVAGEVRVLGRRGGEGVVGLGLPLHAVVLLVRLVGGVVVGALAVVEGDVVRREHPVVVEGAPLVSGVP